MADIRQSWARNPDGDCTLSNPGLLTRVLAAAGDETATVAAIIGIHKTPTQRRVCLDVSRSAPAQASPQVRATIEIFSKIGRQKLLSCRNTHEPSSTIAGEMLRSPSKHLCERRVDAELARVAPTFPKEPTRLERGPAIPTWE